MAKDKPLRDWVEPSYDQDGRYDTVSSSGKGSKQIANHGDGMRPGTSSGAADPGRRNK